MGNPLQKVDMAEFKESHTISKLIDKAVDFISKNLPTILKIAIQLVITLAKGITKSLPKLIPALANVEKTAFTTTSKEKLSKLINTINTIIINAYKNKNVQTLFTFSSSTFLPSK